MSKIFEGTVRMYDAARGFGFISPDDGDGDYFFHHSQLQMDGYRFAEVGDSVRFEVGPGKGDRLQAKNIFFIHTGEV